MGCSPFIIPRNAHLPTHPNLWVAAGDVVSKVFIALPRINSLVFASGPPTRPVLVSLFPLDTMHSALCRSRHAHRHSSSALVSTRRHHSTTPHLTSSCRSRLFWFTSASLS